MPIDLRIFAASVLASLLLPTVSLRADPTVAGAYIKGDSAADNPEKSPLPIGLSRSIVVRTKDYPQWRNDHKATRLILYIDGMAIVGSQIDTELEDQVEFELDPNSGQSSADRDANQKVWSRLLGNPTLAARSVPVAIGPEGAAPWTADSGHYPMLKLEQIWLPGFWIGVCILVVVLIVVFVLGVKTSLLRDTGSIAGSTSSPKAKPTYSLARV